MTAQDEQVPTQGIRPEMSVEDQLRELRGAVRMLCGIAGPWVVQDIRREFPFLFLKER